ncbi:hypothetical protein JYU34_009892 [Plutella xylostella]|uniref:Ig-like domain-containing protein n=1 Tax=Plutella xylostella TaxID=51655 RepID=A0ABQ7QLW3_PLUXY|nr:immunoglobulin superfamily member 10 [Plutella xylostella]KAG7305764.1 hypothetical protein JYU34_009892 [Plutella xylostella]
MPTLGDSLPLIKNTVVTEVPAGSTAVLSCNSNDYDHNFMFWLFDKNKVIGPGNDYDERKYKYEVLSGKLHIDSVSPAESGYYKCVSKKLDGSALTVGEVEMIVKGSAFNAIDAVKLVAIVVSIIVIIGCAVIYWRMRKDWNKYDGRTVVPVDEADDDDEGGDEVYNRTTTSIPSTAPGPSRNVSSDQLLYGIDNQGLDTDFASVFENIQIKSPQQRSLI